jgi:hypothetical protein
VAVECRNTVYLGFWSSVTPPFGFVLAVATRFLFVGDVLTRSELGFELCDVLQRRVVLVVHVETCAHAPELLEELLGVSLFDLLLTVQRRVLKVAQELSGAWFVY